MSPRAEHGEGVVSAEENRGTVSRKREDQGWDGDTFPSRGLVGMQELVPRALDSGPGWRAWARLLETEGAAKHNAGSEGNL